MTPPPVEAPKPKVSEELPALYRTGAEQAMGSDWSKAEVLFERAIQLGDRTDRTAGELALSRGYATIDRLNSGAYAGAGAAKMRDYARAQLQAAAAKLPGDVRVQQGLTNKALATPAVKKTAMYRRKRPGWRSAPRF
jgi:hypothetical protein